MFSNNGYSSNSVSQQFPNQQRNLVQNYFPDHNGQFIQSHNLPKTQNQNENKFLRTNKQEYPQRLRIFDKYHIQEPQIKISQLPLGLRNMGNTCYLNSVLQALLSIEGLISYLVSNQQLPQPLLEIKNLYEMLQKGYKSPQPYQFKKLLDQFCPMFKGYQQQDASECLMYILQLLGNQQTDTLSKQVSTVNDIKDEVLKKKIWHEFRQKENNIITNLFYGMNFTILNCQGCQKETVNFEEMSHLIVELPQIQQTVAIKDQIFLNSKEEQELSGFNCTHCHRTTKVLKKTYFWRLPKVLIVIIKRFDRNLRRINLCVKFPVEKINLSQLVQLAQFHDKGIQEDEINYTLKSIIHHQGTCHSGHYYATCKRGKKWYRLNDEQCNDFSDQINNYETLGSSSPYLIIYEKI